MNLKRLQTFVLVVERRCFSDAAETMKLTQSGVSRQMKALEEEVGIQLLNRNTSFVELTPAGRIVYKRAKSILMEWEQLLQECQELKHELSGVLRIGASSIPGSYLLPKIIKAFQDKHPRVEFSVRIGDSSTILTALENKQIDIAIAGRKPKSPQIQAHCIAEDRLVLIGKKSESMITSLGEIKRRPIIVREPGSGTREAMDRSLKNYGIEPDDLHLAAEVSNTESILAMVEAGIGIALVSYWVVRTQLRDNLSILYELPTDRCFYLTYHESRSTHPLIQSFTQETMRISAANQLNMT